MSAVRETRPALRSGPLLLDPADYSAHLDGEPIHLAPLEFAVLYHLVSHARRVYSAEELHLAAWGRPLAGDMRAVHTVVGRVRAKLGDRRTLLATRRGVGWVWSEPFEWVAPAGSVRDSDPAAVLVATIAALAGLLRSTPPATEAGRQALVWLHGNADVRWLAGLDGDT